MMLMPTGPPATKLVALADASGADEDEKTSIFANFIYGLPLICVAVVGSLKASLSVSTYIGEMDNHTIPKTLPPCRVFWGVDWALLLFVSICEGLLVRQFSAP